MTTIRNPLSDFVFNRTYARKKEDGTLESFEEAIDRVVQATDTQLNVQWDSGEKGVFRDLLLNLKGSVAGRFLWQLGTSTVDRLGLASLQNCAATVIDDPVRPFTWAFDMLMLGSGVGYNLQLKNVYGLPTVKKVTLIHTRSNDADFIVPDSREGWVKLLDKALKAQFITGKSFSYSTLLIRSKGAPIKGFGGTASGDGILVEGITKINKLLNSRAGKKIRPVDALDIMNIIGSIVVAGNVRRSAQIAIGDAIDKQYMQSKRWDLFQIPAHRAMSNNSVVVDDITDLPEHFWEGYNGNGEPFGLINMELSTRVGRLGEERSDNAVAYNPCVTGDTLVLTPEGHKPIEDLVGQSVKVWNGHEFSQVRPYITGVNRPISKVSFSDGRVVRMTYNHTIILKSGERRQLKDVMPGERLAKASLPIIDGTEVVDRPYDRGLYAADGSNGSNEIWLYGKKMLLSNLLDGKIGFTQPHRLTFYLRAKNLSKSFVPSDNSRLQDKLLYLAGLIDGDGHITKDGGIQITSIDKNFLIKLQQLLSTLGVNSRVRLVKSAEPRFIKVKEYLCQDLFRLTTATTGLQDLLALGLVIHNHNIPALNTIGDKSHYVKIESIEPDGSADTYCFTDEKNNSGLFNGVYLGNCSEQPLANYETCCLAEVFLPNIDSEDELWDVVRTLYKVNKHSLMLPCHHPETEEIVHSNMRMGIGVTGWLQASEEQIGWLGRTYQRLREFDINYSKRIGVNPSIRLTTVKPSGTLSLVANVTPGIHPAYSKYLIRRVRVASNNELVQKYKDAGYPVEFVTDFQGNPDRGTVVIEFPLMYPEGTTITKDLTAIQQLEWVKRAQTIWSDNAVSCTVYYKKEELPEIKEWLKENFKNSVKSVSFLLHSDHGFKQAPLEEISEEEYYRRINSIQPLGSISSTSDDDDVENFECEGGACPVR